MGPSNHTDAQNIQNTDSLLHVLHQLDQPLDMMDTEWIDAQLTPMPEAAAPSILPYEQAMRNAAAALKAQKGRAARRRALKRMTAVAASLLLVTAGTFGAANAFQWDGFLRIFSVQNGILSFQTPVEEEDGPGLPETVVEGNTEDVPLDENITLNSAEELLALSTPGDKAFKPLLDKYAFDTGSLFATKTDSLLTLTFLDGSGNRLNIQVSTVNEEYTGSMASSVFFEIDEGSQKNVRIGDDTVITCTNMDVNTVQWITKYGFCHLWGKAGHEELLNIAKILLDAGLKPV